MEKSLNLFEPINDYEMAKDPAFLFFPGDWLGGTMTFSRYHKGAYMDLLMCQFNQGHMALQDIQIVLGDADFTSMWETKLKPKFKQDDQGFFYNQKLEEEVVKRKKFTQSRRNNLNSTPHMEPHMEPHMGTQVDSQMENGDIDGIKDVFKDLNVPFEDFWKLYDKKVGEKEKLARKWASLKNAERESAMRHIPIYKISQPDKTYRKNPSTYLNNKSWNDELIYSKNGSNGTHQQSVGGNGQKLGTSDARTEAAKKW